MKCNECGSETSHESRFCPNCGSAFVNAALGVQAGHASLNAASGRNVRHVLLGALGGIWLGIAFVGALLMFVPRDRRADRLFGAWLGTAVGVLAVAMVIAAVALSSSSGEATNTSADRDIVVGVIRRCTLWSVTGARERNGNDCIPRTYTPVAGPRIPGQSTGYYPQNIRLELTVRTSDATTYTVDVPPETQVAVGDTWPPSR